MIIDARTVPEGTTLSADICLIGGGAAGITLARDLAGGGRSIILLESGGFEFDAATQELYQGKNIGQPLHPLTLERLRFLGGSTNHWSGGCRPFDDLDMSVRSYIPDSGWPITRADLDDCYRRAQKICQLGPYTYETRDWSQPEAVPLSFAERAVFTSGVYQYSPPTRFGEVYRRDLEQGEGLKVYLHANVIDIAVNDGASEVTGLQVACLDGRRFRVEAKGYVLGVGGIENARLLLSANKVQKPGLGNGNDLVGRYFMDHPYVANVATIAAARGHEVFAFYQVRQMHGVPAQGYVQASADTQAKEKLPSFAIGFEPGTFHGQGGAKESLSTLYHYLREGRWPDHLGDQLSQILRGAEVNLQDKYYAWTHTQPATFSTNYICECPPDRDSRVSLGKTTDALGLRRVRVDWRLPQDFEHNLHRAHELLARELGRSGIGRLRMNDDSSGRALMERVSNGYHHMGTTRMHPDPRQGVVDATCRVHGIANLFIAGSSVFPTYSFDNPTMTIVALSLRLSEHLKSVYLTSLTSRSNVR